MTAARLQFDGMAMVSALGLSYLTESENSPLLKGLQGFSAVACGERLIRFALLRGVDIRQVPLSLSDIVIMPLIEEALYSGALMSTSWKWAFLRFPIALAIGSSAATALMGRMRLPSREEIHSLSPDAKVAILYALAREVFLQVSGNYSLPLLISDSLVFALVELSPKKENNHTPIKYSRAWFFRLFTAALFRGTANQATLSSGSWLSGVTEHYLFNFSRGALAE